MSAAEKYFSDDRQKTVAEAISAAEKNTSGEIRLFIENTCPDDVLDRAAFIFHKIGMDKTQEHNGVLFYLAMDSHKFAILGDAGINTKVPKDFWHEIKLQMQMHFAEGDFVKGLEKGIRMAGEALQQYFPYMKDDKDELSNEILFGK